MVCWYCGAQVLATPQYVCLYNPSAYSERKREGCCDAVVWNGRERDVLEYFAAQYRSWLRRSAQRYVNHEIARIAGDPVTESLGASIFFAFSQPQIYLSTGKARDGECHFRQRRARYTFFCFYNILESATGIFFSLLGVVCRNREGLADNLLDTTNCRSIVDISRM